MNKSELIKRTSAVIEFWESRNLHPEFHAVETETLEILGHCLTELQGSGWASGIPVTSGVYWCELEKDGRKFTRTLHYGHYSWVPACDMSSEDIDEMMEPWESRVPEDDDEEVEGVGWYEEAEQFGYEYDWVTIRYGGKRGKVLRYMPLPMPPIGEE